MVSRLAAEKPLDYCQYIEFAHRTIANEFFVVVVVAAIDFTFRHEMRYKLFIYLFICKQCSSIDRVT